MREASEYMSVTTVMLWEKFIQHFRNPKTRETYFGDINEFLEMTQKDFLLLQASDVQRYYQDMKKRVESQEIRSKTFEKKLKELHAFADFILKQKKEYEIPSTFQDYFYGYLVYFDKEDHVKEVFPIEDLDKMLKAAEEEYMTYTILVLFYRVGLLSTDVCALKPADFVTKEGQLYLILREKKEVVYIPKDVAEVLKCYEQVREENEYYFFNGRGNQLNTMYLHRMMRRITQKAGVPDYSAMDLRSAYAGTLYAYGAKDAQVADQIRITQMHIKRYANEEFQDDIKQSAADLIKMIVIPPGKE
ncbi:MAG: site-specific integrase [Lachnospiraceae bacterium]|nr:site-specific integrase [Robinsoniella sp.]MDY3766821.1 site-specific integrase [Lachnospiraceae bacterium]